MRISSISVVSLILMVYQELLYMVKVTIAWYQLFTSCCTGGRNCRDPFEHHQMFCNYNWSFAFSVIFYVFMYQHR
jgi:hypothetical protein